MSENFKKSMGILILLVISFYWYWNKNTEDQAEGVLQNTRMVRKSKVSLVPESTQNQISTVVASQALQKKIDPAPMGSVTLALKPKAELKLDVVLDQKRQKQNPKAAAFKLEDGLVTLAGDIVIGVPKVGDFPNEGWIEPPEFPLWESNEIPFHIQPNFTNSDRIYKAFELFKDTPIHFVPLAHQQDAIVFEEKSGACKSYVGKVGGFQPIWIGEDCSPADIAHELMHALGFIHEQNRTDRDTYVDVMWENILEEFKYNFEILPEAMMRVSGTGKFDYDSIMIYPSSSFSKKAGLVTLKSKQSASLIRSNTNLSLIDIERLQKFYGQ